METKGTQKVVEKVGNSPRGDELNAWFAAKQAKGLKDFKFAITIQPGFVASEEVAETILKKIQGDRHPAVVAFRPKSKKAAK